MGRVTAPFTDEELRDMAVYDSSLIGSTVVTDDLAEKSCTSINAGNEIREYREAIGMSRRQFCRWTGISRTCLELWEGNARRPNWSVIEQKFPDIHENPAIVKEKRLAEQRKIYDYRMENGISIEAAAKKIGCSVQTLREWEYGKKLANWERITKAFTDLRGW